MLSRLKTFALIGFVIGVAFSPGAGAQNPSLDTVRVASGLSQPVFVTAPRGDTSRIFVVEQGGTIRIVRIPGNTLLPTPYLTVTGGIISGGEQGLLGLAFHPNYATNGTFFVDYTANGGGAAGMTVIAKGTVSGNPDVANVTLDTILEINQPYSNHNGGWIAFGPDGYLYIAMGDGGSGDDPQNNAQNINVLLGKILRIDVDGDDFPSDPLKDYAIPPTNPFAGATAGADEIWEYGMRNPWRDSFDRLTGQLYMGDVGQGAVEEVDVVAPGVGGLNFGWRCMEGNSCTGDGGCTCGSSALTGPVSTYTHASGGCAIMGGYVYRGSAICGLQGTYFFADYCSAQISSFRYTGSNNPVVTNRTAELAPGGGLSISSPTSFGEDASGELYICAQGGDIFKIVPGPIIDCNGNGIHDGCDIANGTSMDANGNGIPDECESSTTPYCFGTASACPCANNGAAGNGCASSVNPSGGHLYGTTPAEISFDSFTLIGTGMPDSPALYFQGTTQVNGGNGTSFGDGLRCAGGSQVRIATKLNSAGGSSYPEVLDAPISVQGGITFGPQTRTYQVTYRNSASFCTASTFNLTNAVSVVWIN